MKLLKPCFGRRFLIHCCGAAWLAVLAGTAASRGQTVQFNAQGLSGFNAGTSNLLRDAQLRLQHLARAQDPAEPGGDFDVLTTHYDAAQHRREQTYRWGSLACVYSPATNGLDLSLTVHNASARPIQAIFFDVLQLHFPSEPAGVPWHDHWTILRGGTNSEEPPVVVARWDSGSLALFNETVPPDMVFGFRPEFSTSNQVIVLRRSTPLAAGESVNCRLQLRTGTANASLRDLADSAVDAFFEASSTRARVEGSSRDRHHLFCHLGGRLRAQSAWLVAGSHAGRDYVGGSGRFRGGHAARYGRVHSQRETPERAGGDYLGCGGAGNAASH
jgi:hypothetical protein